MKWAKDKGAQYALEPGGSAPIGLWLAGRAPSRTSRWPPWSARQDQEIEAQGRRRDAPRRLASYFHQGLPDIDTARFASPLPERSPRRPPGSHASAAPRESSHSPASATSRARPQRLLAIAKSIVLQEDGPPVPPVPDVGSSVEILVSLEDV